VSGAGGETGKPRRRTRVPAAPASTQPGPGRLGRGLFGRRGLRLGRRGWRGHGRRQVAGDGADPAGEARQGGFVIAGLQGLDFGDRGRSGGFQIAHRSGELVDLSHDGLLVAGAVNQACQFAEGGAGPPLVGVELPLERAHGVYSAAVMTAAAAGASLARIAAKPVETRPLPMVRIRATADASMAFMPLCALAEKPLAWIRLSRKVCMASEPELISAESPLAAILARSAASASASCRKVAMAPAEPGTSFSIQAMMVAPSFSRKVRPALTSASALAASASTSAMKSIVLFLVSARRIGPSPGAAAAECCDGLGIRSGAGVAAICG